jgi:hypothetical protein
MELVQSAHSHICTFVNFPHISYSKNHCLAQFCQVKSRPTSILMKKTIVLNILMILAFYAVMHAL